MLHPLSPRSLLTSLRSSNASVVVAALLSIASACQDAAAPPSRTLETAPRSADLAATPDAATPGSQGVIAFSSSKSGNLNIYLLDVATGHSRQITRGKANDVSPAWSPDGHKIAFSSNRDGSPHIYVMTPDGNIVTRVTANGSWEDDPAWSPDATKIAYTSGTGLGGADVWVKNADGSGTAVNLTNNAAYDAYPAWSPDGTKIAFGSTRNAPAGATIVDIYITNADGTGSPTRLTTGSGQEPAWSPDGQKIAFASVRDGTWQIYVVNANGTGSPVNLSNDKSRSDVSPSWSSDGTKIVFTSAQNGKSDIYVMNADGTGVVRAEKTAGSDVTPSWRP